MAPKREDSQELVRMCQDRPAKVLSLERMVQTALAWFFQWLLTTFFDLQDAFLAIPTLRRLMAYALAPRCQAAVFKGLRRPSQNKVTFESLEYHVSKESRELLVHASMHAMVGPGLGGGSGKVAPVGRILLQTSVQNSTKYQEAVAAALANELKAHLLVIDNLLLAEIARDALGNALDVLEDSAASFCAYLLSFWLSGGRVAFLYDIVNRAAISLGKPLVLLVRDVETTICHSFDSYDAFVDVFGSLFKPSVVAGMRASGGRIPSAPPMVLLGGCSLGDTGANLTTAGQRKGEQDGTGPEHHATGTPAGSDDTFSLLPDLGITITEELPNPRKMLHNLFMTRVKLEAPSSGAAVVQHRRRLAQDADDLTAERNLQALSSLVQYRASLPPASSLVYRQRLLSSDEWHKVLTWAISMEALSSSKQQLDLAGNLREQLPELTEFADEPASPRGPGRIRRAVSACDSKGTSLDAMAASLQELVKRPISKPRSTSSSAQALSDRKPSGGVHVSERAIKYGLSMLERAGGGMRASIQTENLYERRLLTEVIRAEDAGGGFADVGALSDAKEALREVVQLPLQHPELFAQGSLAKHSCKGVLLFGPPGTGKTLLARAAAAECGASFLAIQPSTVASKWLGDGVRYVRAVFSLAAKLAPCVIFCDEVDALLSRRNSHSEHESLREMKNEFAAVWDGIRPSGTSPMDRVIVLGATNRPQDLDEALLRRFSRRIFIDAPNRKARMSILQVLLEGENLDPDVDLGRVADATQGFSGSDLRQVCTAAAMRPVRELLAASGKSAQLAKQKAAAAVQAGNSSLAGSSNEVAGPQTPSSQPEASSQSEATSQPEASNQPDSCTTASNNAQAELSGLHRDHLLQSVSSTPNTSSLNESPELDAVPNGSVVEAPAAVETATSDYESTSPILSEVQENSMGARGSKESCENGNADKQIVSKSLERRKAALQVLLDDCDKMADAAHVVLPSQLRPMKAADLEAACREVAPTLDRDGHVMDELRQWNATFGDGSHSKSLDCDGTLC